MHLTQLRKANIMRHELIPGPREKFAHIPITGPLLAEIQHDLAKAEHFHFPAVPLYDDDMKASAVAMVEAGVWHLPYPVTTFEFDAILVTPDGKERGVELFILLAIELPTGPHISKLFVRVRQNLWLLIPPEDNDNYDPPTIKAIFAVMMVSLVTKGIRRERYIGDHPVLKHRPTPANSYTRVLIAETIATGQGSPVAERNRVRLHLRRGHVRHQPFGAGRANTKLIWIEPMLVGYSDEGTIEHTGHKIHQTPAKVN